MLALLTDSEFWARWFGIVMIDLLLAGDNAIVIALAVRTLPKREQFLGRIWGTAGAVGLRLLFIAMITYLLQVPLLQAIGGLALLWVAWKLLPSKEHHHPAEGGDGKVKAGSSLGEAIRIIIIADVSMSLDNVLAISATAHGDMVLVIAGIALTVPLVVWGSSLLTVLLNRLPWLVWIGGGVLGYVAGTLLVEDPKIHEWFGKPGNPHLHPIPLGLGAVFILLGWWRARTLGARPPS
jgi:YjbE family integral membrane protein